MVRKRDLISLSRELGIPAPAAVRKPPAAPINAVVLAELTGLNRATAYRIINGDLDLSPTAEKLLRALVVCKHVLEGTATEEDRREAESLLAPLGKGEQGNAD